MIVLNVYYEAKPGKREEFHKAVEESGIAKASRGEAGNRKYDYFRAADDPDLMLLVEHWEDEEAFQFHTQQSHFKALRELKAKYVENTTIMRFEVDE